MSVLAALPGGVGGAGGDVLVGGGYWPVNAASVFGVFRFRPSSGAWVPVSGQGAGPMVAEAPVRGLASIAVLEGGQVVVGGGFSSVAGVPAQCVALYTPAADAWSALGTVTPPGWPAPGLNQWGDALAALPGGDVLAGG